MNKESRQTNNERTTYGSRKMNNLNETEGRELLNQLEGRIRNGLEEFYCAGQEMKRIRDDQLYRFDGFETWESYCGERWDLSKRHCNRLILASEYRDQLPEVKVGPNGPTSWSEASIRELTRIPDKEEAARVAANIVEAVKQSEVESATNPDVNPLKLTSSTVRRFVDEELDIDRTEQTRQKKEQLEEERSLRLEDYLRTEVDTVESLIEQLAKVPAESWQLLEESEPGLVERLAAACDALAELLLRAEQETHADVDI